MNRGPDHAGTDSHPSYLADEACLRCRGRSTRSQCVDDLMRLGKTPGLMLAEHTFSVGHDVEDSTAAADQLGFHADLGLDFLRQTGGSWKVVSVPAVGDRNGHGSGS